MWVLIILTVSGSAAASCTNLEMCRQQFRAMDATGITAAYCLSVFGDRVDLFSGQANQAH